jgi:hypothetical protein
MEIKMRGVLIQFIRHVIVLEHALREVALA